MNQLRFDTFFQSATDNHAPYEYQCRLACGELQDRPDNEWLTASAPCQSKLIDIPTGLGKTAAVVLAWLWNRVCQQNAEWPRRLVYCLPMRTLVDQTQEEVSKWLDHLRSNANKLGIQGQMLEDLNWLADHSPVILMGGEDAADWDIYPERPAILIGTQDMLLSRALNRGYGMSRYRWPMHFGLLNNDCLWIMDETQLMGVGVETSAQLDGFRQHGKIPTCGSCPTWWMSATLHEARLATVDHPKPSGGWPIEQLGDAEKENGQPHRIINAQKQVIKADLVLSSAANSSYPNDLAALIKEHHKNGSLTLVVVNRVSRARDVFKALTRGKSPLFSPTNVALIHSRFRPMDRQRHAKLLFSEGDRVVVATQAVEAGVDVSARVLITELAPWSSLVQRLGRCNRRGDMDDAEVVWVDIVPKDEKDDLLLPYSAGELEKAKAELANLNNASPAILRTRSVPEESVIRPVIRRRDLVDLFDTTPDICGQDLDVSRYIRDGDDNDVQFYWRSFKEEPGNELPPERDELCRVSMRDASRFLGKKAQAWRWNPLTEQWEVSKVPRPGGVYLLRVESGGYSSDMGWSGDPKDKPEPHVPQADHGKAALCGEIPMSDRVKTKIPLDGLLDGYAGNHLTFDRQWQPLAGHTGQVVEMMETVASVLRVEPAFANALKQAALWHDIGKAHPVFQKALRTGDSIPEDNQGIYAKSANAWSPKAIPLERKGFRHELASALAWLLSGPAETPERDLVGFLIAAHHGKVRLSIRSMPSETGNPQKPDGLFARGVWEGDVLPPIVIGELVVPQVILDLSFMQMGEGLHGASWLARTIALRDRLGPFYLAFLETLLRAADARGSMKCITD